MMNAVKNTISNMNNISVTENGALGYKTTGSALTDLNFRVSSMRTYISDAYCVFTNGELFIKNMYISEYKHAGYEKCEVVRDRKLLLTKHELRKLSQNVKTKGNTIIPLSVFINDRGLCKIKLALASGKHSYDKSQSIKERDLDRELKRSIF